MDFDFTEEQSSWREVCARLSRTQSERIDVSGENDFVLEQASTLGVIELVAETQIDLTELCILFEELGRSAYRGALLEMLAGELVARMLGIPSKVGSSGFAGQDSMVFMPRSTCISSQLGESPHHRRLSGVWRDVVGIDHAALVFFQIEIDGDAGVAVVRPSQAGVSINPTTAIEGRPTSTVVFNAVEIDRRDEDAVTNSATLQSVNTLLQVGRAAEMVGGAAEVINRTVSHTLERVVFARPIARYQAVQHALASAELLRAVARLATYEAASPEHLVQGENPLVRSTRALMLASRAYTTATTTAAHINAGAGHIDDHWLPKYYARAKALDLRTGGSSGRALDSLKARGVLTPRALVSYGMHSDGGSPANLNARDRSQPEFPNAG